MADEINEFEEDEENQETQAQVKRDKVDKRIKSLIDKLEAASKERDEAIASKAELEKARAEDSFKSAFNEQSSKYPYAKDHEADIKNQTDKGLSVEDATLLVLTKEKKLISAEDIESQKAEGGAFGGSADTKVGEKKEIKDMTQAERLAALYEAESRGEISL
jgi:hypothetical protein